MRKDTANLGLESQFWPISRWVAPENHISSQSLSFLTYKIVEKWCLSKGTVAQYHTESQKQFWHTEMFNKCYFLSTLLYHHKTKPKPQASGKLCAGTLGAVLLDHYPCRASLNFSWVAFFRNV